MTDQKTSISRRSFLKSSTLAGGGLMISFTWLSAFKNTGKATGVGLYFYETDGRTLFSPAGDITEKKTLTPDKSGIASMTFKAGYVSVTDAPAAGDFKSQVTLSINYL